MRKEVYTYFKAICDVYDLGRSHYRKDYNIGKGYNIENYTNLYRTMNVILNCAIESSETTVQDIKVLMKFVDYLLINLDECYCEYKPCRYRK